MWFQNDINAAAETADGRTYTLTIDGEDIAIGRGERVTRGAVTAVCDEDGRITVAGELGTGGTFSNQFSGSAPQSVTIAHGTIDNLRLD